jgi:tripeptide aminopeptidase
MKDVAERFIQYCSMDSQSAEADVIPSTKEQFALAELLYNELCEMGADARMDREHAYVYAEIPANTEKPVPAVGFISHMDTSPAVPASGVTPVRRIYNGGDLEIGEGVVLTQTDEPMLAEFVGRELITSDGRTLLGADDKAGVAEIMDAAQRLLSDPTIKHGRVCIGFTPDEEVGHGADLFDVAGFGADYAYTVDGGWLGGIEYECFNAAGAKLTVKGRSTHPGGAKGSMKNALLMWAEFQALLPVGENPMYTEGYEGFYHPDEIHGACDCVTVDYIIRDHDRAKFEAKKLFFKNAAAFMNEKYGAGSFTVDMTDSYYNMREKIEEHMEVVRIAEQAMRNCGIEPKTIPIRGGTDGARLSYMGLPCPNICTGGFGFHSRFEFIPTFALSEVSNIIIEIIKLSAE